MKLKFKQGIVVAQAGFLVANGSNVDLIVQPTAPVLLSFADKDADYLVSERVSINAAWHGPFIPSTNYWLYWDLSVKTAILTRGFTSLVLYLVRPHQHNQPTINIGTIPPIIFNTSIAGLQDDGFE